MKKQKIGLNKLSLKKETIANLTAITGGEENTFFSYCYCATMQHGCASTECPPHQEPKPPTGVYSVCVCDRNTVSAPFTVSLQGGCDMTDPTKS